ncbi:MAG: RNA-binding protein [Candidatus Muiribacterium halophilum]|uniref:RNA-binding protein KhpA n=1 Tax=Muiribacterium halophilum TaxID=2053465 RepID=A0A2N5ZIK6_MUIH1|nr:MAG: RNA-binding protein [Candidatus Muirbacterium halophilum]
MKDLLRYLIEAIVDDNEAISINEVDGEKTMIFEVKVADADVGKLIGKKGRTINAIRTVVKAATSKGSKKVMVEVLQ